MAYNKTQWKKRVCETPDKFAKSQETPTSVVLTNTPGAVSEPGTLFSIDNMNKIEQGIFDAHEAVAGEKGAREAAVSAEKQARETAVSAEETARKAADGAEKRERETADAALANAVAGVREAADRALRNAIDAGAESCNKRYAELLVRAENNETLVAYLISFIEAEIGLPETEYALVTEDDEYLVTEDGDCLVTG
jgi:hypothetical protein